MSICYALSVQDGPQTYALKSSATAGETCGTTTNTAVRALRNTSVSTAKTYQAPTRNQRVTSQTTARKGHADVALYIAGVLSVSFDEAVSC